MDTLSLSNLHQFFERYADCISRGDGRGIASFFSIPCIMISDEKSTAFTDFSTIEVLFLQGFTFLRKHGIVEARPDVHSRRTITPQIVQCNLVWTYYDALGNPLYSCDYLYGLHRNSKGELKIETSLSINEKERMNTWLGGKPELGIGN